MKELNQKTLLFSFAVFFVVILIFVNNRTTFQGIQGTRAGAYLVHGRCFDLDCTTLYYNGIIQQVFPFSSINAEPVIHGPMLSLEKPPQKVLILGGGDGSVLREVLKYNSVVQVVVVEPRKDLMKLARTVPSFVNCSFLDLESADCFDAPQVTLIHETAEKYLPSLYHANCDDTADYPDAFDVVFNLFHYDALAPARLTCFVRKLYITQLRDPLVPSFPRKVDIERVNTVTSLASKFNQDVILFDVKQYSEHGVSPKGFVMYSNDADTTTNWRRNDAAVNLAARQRLRKAAKPLSYYDGSVHATLVPTPRAWEDAYCAITPTPWKCKWKDQPSVQDNYDFPTSESFLKLRSRGEGSEKEVTSTIPLKKGTHIGLYDAATSIKLSKYQVRRLKEFVELTDNKWYKEFYVWLMRYGYACDVTGDEFFVSVDSLITYVNHGCTEEAINVGGWRFEKDDFWEPVSQRRSRETCIMSEIYKDVPVNTPFFEDYKTFDFEGEDERDKETQQWCP
eukprot:m.285942 g.285942  ORF g.285942 m.285942 type:complete len:508 (+) comp16347_c0_seq1:70-1593(+)